MRTIITAGHLTTGNTLCFILYELARHPDVQEKVRSEIDMMLAAVHERGKMDYNMSDLDGMHFVLAVLKEVMRLHPVIYDRTLLAKADDILPLSKPIVMTNGKMLSELPVRAGQYVHVSIAGYNRLKDVWGSDAHAFRPGRWFDGSITTRSNFGVFGNLANFAVAAYPALGGDLRALLPSSIAIVNKLIVHKRDREETFMVEILRNFHISLPEEKILRASSGIMSPMLSGSPEKGMQLPSSFLRFCDM
ncbi:hypothetical protein A0H81_13215 [Grifola frondosa]|uniref:Cytochrome P450 n=1 Tax=Grifola frondosa TaxID=5627 RepID=A0A1C7LQ95_GRIFR|nr:hypothetical protein A0H81_13215 [Grifola frondosa]